MHKDSVMGSRSFAVSFASDGPIPLDSEPVREFGETFRERQHGGHGQAEGTWVGRESIAASYLGLVPAEDSSGERRRLGHISKQGNCLLRFLLVEAAQSRCAVVRDGATIFPPGDASRTKDR